MKQLAKLLQEDLQAAIPEYPVEVAGHSFTLRFDVNINKTKKGIKLQFVADDLPTDVRLKQKLTNDISTELQKKFGDAKLQVTMDMENPYNNVIGFLIPLPSIADHIMELAFPEALQGQGEQQPAEQEPEQAPEEQPAAEEEPQEEKPAPLPKEPMAERKITFRDFY